MPDATITTSKYSSVHIGPFEYEGSKVFCILMTGTSNGTLEAWGASWYNGSWSEKDASNAPTTQNYLGSVPDCWFDGRYIHIAHCSSTAQVYSRFDCEDETWDITDQNVITDAPKAFFPSDKYHSITVRPSDGRIFYAYTEDEPKKGYFRARYAYSDNGTSWTTGQTIPSSPDAKEVEYQLCIWFDDDEIMHYFYSWNGVTTDYDRLRCWNGAAWSAETTCAANTYPRCFNRPGQWDDSGTKKVTMAAEYAYACYAIDITYTSGSVPSFGSWTSIHADTTGGTVDDGRAVVIYDDEPMVFTNYYISGYQNNTYYITRSGGSWDTPAELEDVGNPCSRHSTGYCTDSGYVAVIYGYSSNVVIECYPSCPPKPSAGGDQVYLF